MHELCSYYKTYVLCLAWILHYLGSLPAVAAWGVAIVLRLLQLLPVHCQLLSPRICIYVAGIVISCTMWVLWFGNRPPHPYTHKLLWWGGGGLC